MRSQGFFLGPANRDNHRRFAQQDSTMNWIDKIVPAAIRSETKERRASVPEGLWKKCVKCDAVLYRPELEKNLDVCPKCDHHMHIGARQRLDTFLDVDNRAE